jgi:RNA polymerase sigma-70 factor (ECF subfamily)
VTPQDIVPHLPRLRYYALSLLRGRPGAEDLVQDTLLRALEKQHLYREDTNLRGWLVTIMHNEHVNKARAYRHTVTMVSDEVLAEMGRGATQEAPVELAEVLRAVARLSPEHREALVLHWVHGYRYDEIAPMLGIPIGTVQSRISRARAHLRKILEDPDAGIGVARQ